MTTNKVLLEFDITKEQQEKLDYLSKKWGLSENDVLSRIIDIESSTNEMTDKETVIKTSNNAQS